MRSLLTCVLLWQAVLANCGSVELPFRDRRSLGQVISLRPAAPQRLHCRNPNGNPGVCTMLEECPRLRDLLYELKEQSFRFVEASRCPGRYSRYYGVSEKSPFVCCTEETNFVRKDPHDRIIFPDEIKFQLNNDLPKTIVTAGTTTQPTTTTSKNANRNNTTKNAALTELLPRPLECGAVAIFPKIYGGKEADFNEFPWMVNLEYRMADGSLTSICSGSLINDRYVLTAAHCVTGEVLQKVGQLVSVVLGDYNTATEVDCLGTYCNGPKVRVNLESVIFHKEYVDKLSKCEYHQHDIALLRLDKAVRFTDAIKPICLPYTEMDKQFEFKEGMKLTVAGWGHNGTAKSTDIKHKVRIPYVSNEECSRFYANKLCIAPDQLCAGGVFMQDSCGGDSGGPLMRLGSGGWVLEGVVSFGLGCGKEQPAIYTRVRSYMHWIEEHLLP